MCLQDATGLVARCFQHPFARHPAAIFIASFGNFLPSSAALSSLISVTLGSPSPFWPFQTLPLSFMPYPRLPPTLWTLVFSVDDSFWSFRFFHSFKSRLQGALSPPTSDWCKMELTLCSGLSHSTQTYSFWREKFIVAPSSSRSLTLKTLAPS